ncbi:MULTISPECIES: DUF881 domain-containing protein [unclassified Streptomyces]|uniref:DUF881 domain-containing protein n=1 Tax=unclassified Streptomyces TaxID=2593676 RepID=UPI000C27551B|nr:DUF881 domain-containing protein [Streptomyces sp. CB02959]PJN41525.1 hypothetical protein CG747_06995 [Streptomyces sp. CB02959]
MSTSAGSPGRPLRARLRPVRLLTLLVFALAGLMFWLSFDTARGTNLRSDDSMLRLSDLIQERSHKNGSQDERNAGLRAEVDGLARRDTASSATAEATLQGLEKNAGTKPVSGQGLTVTLTDAPPNATAKIPGIPEPQPNDLVIHQQDLQAVVNALWHGGAKGIKVMDQRLISTSAVRCVGNTLILQGRVYSPPYKITAVGDHDALNRALTASPAIQNYLQYVNAYGLGWKVDQHEAVTLPGYSGTVDLHYAQPVKP